MNHVNDERSDSLISAMLETEYHECQNRSIVTPIRNKDFRVMFITNAHKKQRKRRSRRSVHS